MQVDILFFDDNSSITIRDVKNILSDITGISIKQDMISLDHHDISYELKLSANERYVYLNLQLEGKNKANASVLSSVKKLIRNGKHRAGYNIVISYDESSMYFNKKLFSFISEHESKLRQLIYLILIDIFGSTWVRQTLDEKQQTELKNNLRSNKLIERGLEAFSYHEYISFLFDQRPNKFTNDFIDRIIEEIESAEEINKTKLLTFFRNNKSHSLWESSFSEIDYVEAEKDIRAIRDIRNSVMHNKEISTQEFEKNKKLIRKSNKGLDRALEYVKSEHIREIRPDEVLISLQETIANIGSQYAALLEPMRDAVSALNESISKVYDSSALDLSQALRDNIKNAMLPFSNLYQNTRLSDSMKTFQNIQQLYIDILPKIDIPEIDFPNMHFNPQLNGEYLPESPVAPLVAEEIEDENTKENEENSDFNDESET